MSVRCLLGALVLVMALATSARGNCAWVLWQQADNLTTHAVDGPSPQASYTTVEECIRRIDGEYQTVGAQQTAWNRSAPTEATVMFVGRGRTSLFTFTCLPDTVDPRGPKGK